MTEFFTTALLLTIFGSLLITSASLSRTLERVGIPVALLFLFLGMLAGEQGIGGIAFEDYRFSFIVGTIALVLIVFDGGFNTTYASIREGIRPALLLATVGVLLTAALTAVFARAIGLSWAEAVLLGAVVSSTDAATVFAVMRGSKLSLQRRVGTTLELESGLNDAVAVLLTIGATQAVATGEVPGVSALWGVPWQMAVGSLTGLALGRLGRWLLVRVRISTGGLYAVVTMGLALFSFGIATLLGGSGFLSVFATASVLGNGRIPYQSGLRRIHDAMAWLSQVAMFLMLGFLVFPSRILSVALPGVLLALFLAFVARPIAVAACLLPFRFPAKEVGYIGWVGLRGAVPIILATYPVLSGVSGAERVFDIVFVLVVVNSLVPGATIRRVTKWLDLDVPPAAELHATLEITSMGEIDGDLLLFHIDSSVLACDGAIRDLHLPEGASIALIVRGSKLLAARGPTILRADDQVYVFSQHEDRALVTLIFGQPKDV
ncbi:K(+)/H(+) antiporter NhaP [Planctomycetes bacterium Poly30]|uniref:K(+)/H(+) antiporter NhaP n=1 Tax=Saltatorellus ferox TaxID=2528018 RepID=A0A518EPZ7_9BACT|nr:K(+)/H(+) antiporter NhaP [Planctomycetes bacterium Poly30]